MADETNIGWTDSTFNPWRGCEKVSPGCAHCYAEGVVTGRLGETDAWGADGVRVRASAALLRRPLAWERDHEAFESEHGHRRRVFCSSLADVFEPRPELEEWRVELFALIERTPSLDWQLLTKRPEEARDWLRAYYAGGDTAETDLFGREWISRDGLGWGVLPNVWIGTSIENARFTWRADVLREIPAAVRFISAEPLLGSLLHAPPSDKFERGFLAAGRDPEQHAREHPMVRRAMDDATLDALNDPKRKKALDLTGIDWLIAGGESGGRASRPMHPEWARELRDACDQYDYIGPDSNDLNGERWGNVGPAFFFKQWGSYAPRGFVSGKLDVDERHTKEVRGDPTAGEGGRVTWNVCYYGAKPTAGGNVLDGRTWAEFPTPAPVPVAA